MLFTINEILDIVIMALAIGFMFKDMFKTPQQDYDPLKPRKDKGNFWFAAASVGSSIILHELGHKFIAMSFGLTATFHAAYEFLALGLILKLMNVGLIFFVPAYVSHGITTPINSAFIAFAGPLVNLLLWAICSIAIRQKKVPKKYLRFVFFTKYINGFLFIVNMLPIPGLDGFWVYKGIFSYFV
jgi:Zn-dependent protease